MDKAELIKFRIRSDGRGSLIALEGGSDIPFGIKRIFYIYGTDKDAIRGSHANRRSEFVLICISGSCRVRTDDGRGDIREFELGSPDIGLYIPRMVWKDMYGFSENCVLLCLSDQHYDADEYMRDMDEFRKETR